MQGEELGNMRVGLFASSMLKLEHPIAYLQVCWCRNLP